MTTKIFISTLFAIAILTSCNDSKRHAENSSPFIHFIGNMDRVKLPFHYDLVAQDIEKAKKPTLADTQFIQEQDYIIGLLPDTFDNYKVLYLSTGDDFYPSLKIFGKTGKTLSNNSICFPDCAAGDCEFDSCNSYVDIQINRIVRTISTIKTDCDSLGNKIANSTHKQIKSDFISINKSGQLETHRH